MITRVAVELFRNRRGVSAAEYAVLLLTVGIALIGAWTQVGQSFVCQLSRAQGAYLVALGASSTAALERCAQPGASDSLSSYARDAQRRIWEHDPTATSSRPSNPAMMTGDGAGGGATMADLPPVLAGRTGLGAQIEGIVGESADGSANLDAALKNGLEIVWGIPGKGSAFTYVDGIPTITLDPNLASYYCWKAGTSVSDTLKCVDERTEDLVTVLTHELGHATYVQAWSTSNDAATRIDENTTFSLQNEGHAEISRVIAEREISAKTGHVFTPWSGNDADYQAIYDRFKAGAITRAQADAEAGEIFRHGERPGLDPSKDYDQYYRDFFTAQEQAAWEAEQRRLEDEFRRALVGYGIGEVPR